MPRTSRLSVTIPLSFLITLAATPLLWAETPPADGEGQVAAPPDNLPVNPPSAETSPAVSPPPTPVVAESARPAPRALELPAWLRNLTIGGGAILWYYEPFVTGVENNVSLFFANVVLDARFDRFGIHIEPRFRETKLRPFFDGPAWVQEAYAHYTVASGDSQLVVKAGKAYSHFGLFWDNSFYGNVQVYDGLKLDPDYGLSLEGVLADKAAVGLRGWAQYFVIDGQTNVSLPGRDTFSIPGARRRNQIIGRLEPFARIGEGGGIARLGLSAEFLQPELPVIGKQNVFRGAVDLTVSAGGGTLWGEYTRQNGQTVTDFPVAATPATAGQPGAPGQASKHNNYLLAGGEYTLGLFTARYVFSRGDYHDVDVTETMHVPSLGVALDPNLSVLSELVVWQRNAAGVSSFVDRSLNVTLYGHF
jgi:hypothetical protein